MNNISWNKLHLYSASIHNRRYHMTHFRVDHTLQLQAKIWSRMRGNIFTLRFDINKNVIYSVQKFLLLLSEHSAPNTPLGIGMSWLEFTLPSFPEGTISNDQLLPDTPQKRFNSHCDVSSSVGAAQHCAPAPTSPSLLGPSSICWWRPGRRKLPVLPRLWTPLLLRLLGQLCEPRGTGQSHEPRHRKRTVSAGENTVWNMCVVLDMALS